MPGSPAEAAAGPGDVVVRAADYLWFADLALAEMARIVGALGDELANEAPALPGANTPFAILTHCVGLMESWGGATGAGRSIERDRVAEFTARGNVGSLVERTEAARLRLHEDVEGVVALDVPTQVMRDPDDPVPYSETKGAVLLHILEELFQHLGQMEISRDMLQAAR